MIMRELDKWMVGQAADVEHQAGGIDLFALTLNIDDLHGLNATLARLFGKVVIGAASASGQDVPCATVDDLVKLPSYSRDQFFFRGEKWNDDETMVGSVVFSFSAKRPARVFANGQAAVIEPLVSQAVATLRADAHQRTAAHVAARAILTTAFVLYFAALGVALAFMAAPRTVPLMVLLTLLAVGAWSGVRKFCEMFIYRSLIGNDGVRIDPLSRVDRQERRWNERRDRKVAVVWGPIGAAVGAGLLALIYWVA